MNDEEIRQAVAASPALLAEARVGNDVEIARQLTLSAPMVMGPPRFINGLTILAAFPDPADGEAALQALEAIGEQNPVVKRALSWMAPGAPGLDIASLTTQGMLDQLRAAELLTEAQVNTIKGLALVPDVVTHEQVSAALLETRVDGLVPGGEA